MAETPAGRPMLTQADHIASLERTVRRLEGERNRARRTVELLKGPFPDNQELWQRELPHVMSAYWKVVQAVQVLRQRVAYLEKRLGLEPVTEATDAG